MGGGSAEASGIAPVRHQGCHGPALHGVGRPPRTRRGRRAGFPGRTAPFEPLSGHGRLSLLVPLARRSWRCPARSRRPSPESHRTAWRCRSGGKNCRPGGTTRNGLETPALRAFRDAAGAQNGTPPGGPERIRRGKMPSFTGFQRRKRDGKNCLSPILRPFGAVGPVSGGISWRH